MKEGREAIAVIGWKAQTCFNLQRCLIMDDPALDQFKVDVASVEDTNNTRIFLYNVNFPLRLWQDESAVIRIWDTVARDFNNSSGIYFQLSATYTQVNWKSGEARTWSGSFNPRNRTAGALTSHQLFEPDSFVPFVQAHSWPEWVHERLTAGRLLGAGKISQWTLDVVKSIIISFQSCLKTRHSLFIRYPNLLRPGRYGRQGRQKSSISAWLKPQNVLIFFLAVIKNGIGGSNIRTKACWTL